MIQKQRLGEIEILRGMAFAAVVLQHSIAHYSVVPEVTAGDGVRLTLMLLAAKFAVPAFIFITGLVLFYNYDGVISYSSFIRKRFKDIIVPYLLWSLLYAGLNGTYARPVIEWLPDVTRYWYTGKSSYHLWYIVMIIPMYLLFPFLRTIVRKAVQWTSDRRYGILILPGVLFAGYELILLLRPWLSELAQAWQIPVLMPYFTTYADRNIVYYLYYFLLGALAGLHINTFLDTLRRVKFPVVLLCGLFVVYYTGLVMGGYPLDATYGRRFIGLTLLQPLMAVFLTASVLLVYQLALSITKSGGDRHRQFWITISRYSYGGYLAHALMLRITYELDDWIMAGWDVTIRTLITAVITLGLSVLLTYLLTRIPYGVWLTGIPYKKVQKQA
ncbi:acyltransferase [Paenibacillus wulumuqiensis]|uniref:acyltransferase n=1 Tax=Paenibacillus wulumuqiensis TaxID=1567107 RepID=UPI000619CE61|nr:acyltransferase [Paenibacillus wulumuqiensis]